MREPPRERRRRSAVKGGAPGQQLLELCSNAARGRGRQSDGLAVAVGILRNQTEEEAVAISHLELVKGALALWRLFVQR